jgi:HK97 family phage major capsid protein
METTQIGTKSALIALLKSDYAYNGDGSLPNVKEFLANTPEIELGGPDGKSFDLDALWAAKRKVTVGGKSNTRFGDPEILPPDAGEEKADEPRTDRKAGKANAAMSRGMSAKNWANIAARKSYDRRAQRGETAFPDSDMAEQWGAYVRLSIASSPHCSGRDELTNYGQKSWDEEILGGKASATVNVAAGGALIPEDFLPILIELREQYGVFPAAVGTTSMSSDRLPMPRNTGDATVYWATESVAATESDGTFDNPALTAAKLLGLNRHPFEMMNDPAIKIADVTARSFAREAARKIDDAGFNGDGTNGYGGFTGICAALKALSGTIANIAGLVVASGNLISEYTAADFWDVTGRLPVYADTPNTAWYCHKQRYWNAIERLGRAVGGVTYNEFTGKAMHTLAGYPVKFSQVMPRVDANSQVDFVFGDLSLGCKYGEVRNSMALDTSDQRYFDQDQVAIRYRQRVSVLVHDVGNASATAASRVPGPIVGLISAAS